VEPFDVDHSGSDGNNGGFSTGPTPTPAPPSYTPNGKVGGAFAFDGTNYVQIPDAPNLQPSQITLEMWVFPTVWSSTSYQTVIGRGLANGTGDQWWLGVLNGTPQFFIDFEGPGEVLAAPTTIPLNEWTHLAATFDGATQVLYVNGIQVAAQAHPNAIFYESVPVGIGAHWQNNTPTDRFTGFIDEVSLYDRALTPAEIFAIVTAGAAGK
jgi:Concanavalin A-like lectin/glucanases superfamily